jgi:hypothetical protein
MSMYPPCITSQATTGDAADPPCPSQVDSPARSVSLDSLQVDRALALLAYLTQVVAAYVLRIDEAELEVEDIEDEALRFGIEPRMAGSSRRLEIARSAAEIGQERVVGRWVIGNRVAALARRLPIAYSELPEVASAVPIERGEVHGTLFRFSPRARCDP